MGKKSSFIRACCRGQGKGHRNQDCLKVVESKSCLLAIVADGLGCASFSSVGSKLICVIMSRLPQKTRLCGENIPELLGDAISEWYREVAARGFHPQDCSTTCSLVIVSKDSNICCLCQIGDSPIFYRVDGGDVYLLSEEKDFLNETPCVGAMKRPFFAVKEVRFNQSFDFLVASDGFGDEIVPEFAGGLFDYFTNKYSGVCKCLRNNVLKHELIKTMHNRNNDDKSLIFGWICQ